MLYILCIPFKEIYIKLPGIIYVYIYIYEMAI